MKQNQIQCMRPCYDCPFRNDIVPYQTIEDVRENAAGIENPYHRFACHHTCKFDGRKVEPGSGKILTCAGFLIMRQKLGIPLPLFPLEHKPIKDQPYVFSTVEELLANGACPDQSREGRIAAYRQNKKQNETNP